MKSIAIAVNVLGVVVLYAVSMFGLWVMLGQPTDAAWFLMFSPLALLVAGEAVNAAPIADIPQARQGGR